jgi:hypothetical protein
MASKKLKKAIMAGLAGYAGAKLLGSKTSAANVDSGRGGKSASAMARTRANSSYKDSIMSGGKGATKSKIGIGQKAKNVFDKIIKMGPGKNATSKKGGTLAGDYGDAFGDGFSGGAKAGKMIKARGGKMVNLKPTKLY